MDKALFGTILQTKRFHPRLVKLPCIVTYSLPTNQLLLGHIHRLQGLSCQIGAHPIDDCFMHYKGTVFGILSHIHRLYTLKYTFTLKQILTFLYACLPAIAPCLSSWVSQSQVFCALLLVSQLLLLKGQPGLTNH